MAINPKKWTTKTHEAISAASALANGAGNPELTVDHLLHAVVSQEDTIVPAFLQKLGVAAGMLRSSAEERIAQQTGGSDYLVRSLLVVRELMDHRQDLGHVRGHCFTNRHDRILAKSLRDQSCALADCAERGFAMRDLPSVGGDRNRRESAGA